MFTIPKIKLNQKQLLTSTIITLIVGAFYWSQVRPVIINQKCHDLAQDGISDSYSGGYNQYSAYYVACQHEHGL